MTAEGAVVCTVTVTSTGVTPSREALGDETWQVDAVGAPAQLKLTVSFNPSGASVRWKTACWPGETVSAAADPAGTLREKSIPVPASATACGLPGASVVIWRVAVRLPAEAGVKVRLRAQLAPGLSDPPQALSSEKSLPAEPVTATPLIASVASPVLLSVKDWALLVVPTTWLEKLKLEADSKT